MALAGAERIFTLLDEKPEFRVTEARIEDILAVEKNNRITEEVLYFLIGSIANARLTRFNKHQMPTITLANMVGNSVSAEQVNSISQSRSHFVIRQQVFKVK